MQGNVIFETRLMQSGRYEIMKGTYTMYRRIVNGLLVLLLVSTTGYASVLDSLRMERRPEGLFIIHRVEAGETLYSLARRYAADLASIAKVNKLDGYAIDSGQILAIPYVKPEEKPAAPADRTVHKVKAGETLYAISHIYGVNIYDIKKWNNLSSDDLALGQELIVSGTSEKQQAPAEEEPKQKITDAEAGKHVVKQGETLYAVARQYEVTYAQLKEWNQLTSDDLSIGQVLKVQAPTKPVTTPVVKEDPPTEVTPIADTNQEAILKPVESTDQTDTDSQTGKDRIRDQVNSNENQFEKVYEEGVAMEIENSPKTQKYLCLHRSLPVGTIVQVKNLMNSQSIFVRVIGKLPPTGNNENVLIRLSSIAYKRLGAIDARFPVELSYIPD